MLLEYIYLSLWASRNGFTFEYHRQRGIVGEREKKEAAIEMKEKMWERNMGIESESIDMREREGFRNDI